MKDNRTYSINDQFIFRVPHFDAGSYKSYPRFIKSCVFQEALFDASPSLYKILEKADFEFEKLNQKAQISILKYVYRICSRCSPFGTFAGIGIGLFSNRNDFIINEDSFNATVKPSFAVVKELDRIVKSNNRQNENIRYFPNGTIIHVFNKIRFVKREADIGGEQDKVIEIINNNYLRAILKVAIGGIEKKNLVFYLLQRKFVTDIEDAKEFIDLLIDENVLVSELDSDSVFESITYFESILAWLPSEADISFKIKKLDQLFVSLNEKKIGQRVAHLKSLEKLIFEISEKPKETNKSIFKTDMFLKGECTINIKHLKIIEEGINILNVLTNESSDYYLDDFKNNFYNRYEFAEVPLLEALDSDIGIGFGFSSYKKTNKFLSNITDTLASEGKSDSPTLIINQILFDAYKKSLKNKKDFVSLSSDDFTGHVANWVDSPSNMLAGIEIYSNSDDDSEIYLNFAGSSSASNVLGRFYEDSIAIENLVKKIISDEEAQLDANTVFAEIHYHPENEELCNILKRTSFRNYNINVNGSPKEQHITLDELFVSLDGNRNLKLRSSKLKKYIIPRNTTAHNYNNSNNPIYKFLSSLFGEKHRKPHMKLSWGNLDGVDGFFPRVVYENKLILSLAKWKIKRSDIDFNKSFKDEFARIKSEKAIPDKVFLGEDSGLLIDFTIPLSIEIIKSEFKGDYIFLQEVLYRQDSALVKSKNTFYHHEILLVLNKISNYEN